MLTSAAMQMKQLLMYVSYREAREKLSVGNKSQSQWFNHNYMKLNAETFEFLITGHRFEHFWLNVGETNV